MIYIDLRGSFTASKNSGKFNGGNNYSQKLLELICCAYNNTIIIVGEVAEINYIACKYNIDKDQIIVAKDLSEIKFLDNSIYFNPQASDSKKYLKDILFLKQTYPTVRIKMTIHDRRYCEDMFDRYNGLLKEGIKRHWFFLGVSRFFLSLRKDKIVRKLLMLSDEIYTVSNHSMQQLLKLHRPRSINYYIQEISFDSNVINSIGNYILFVSAGRSEKNFIRALKAFELYVKRSGDNNIKLKVTGLTQYQSDSIRTRNIIDNSILNNQVEMFGYISPDELAQAYAGCRFLLFVSKSEGFGLPVSEALFFGKPVVASRTTSIPEVMGSVAIYVDPYSTDSICTGIQTLMNDYIYKQQLNYIEVKREIWIKQKKLDNELIVKKIIGDEM